MTGSRDVQAGHGIRPEVRMGNDIVRQFAHLGDEAAGARAAEHMAKFWDDRMRDNLRDAVRSGDPDATHALVVAEAILEQTRVEQAEFTKPSGG